MLRLRRCSGSRLVRRQRLHLSPELRMFCFFTSQAEKTEHLECEESCVTYVHSSLSSGLIEYSRGWAWQQAILSRRLEARRNAERFHCENDTDCILFLEHKPVYTLGRGADELHLTFLQDDESDDRRQKLSRSNRGAGSSRLSVDRRLEISFLHQSLIDSVKLLADIATPVMAPNDVPIYRVERGGEVTFHGPGQLVAYPLLDLRRPPYKQDLHWYLRMVEEVVLRTLQWYGIEGHQDDENTGVWVDENKIAAVGVSSSRWITTHGFALNVSPDLDFFDTSLIVPCGIEGKGVTSISKVLMERGSTDILDVEKVAAVAEMMMKDVFGVPLRQSPKDHVLI